MYADVILPLPLSGLFTYAVPTDMQDKIGRGFRVVVPFGRRKYYTAIVAKVHRQLPGNFTIKKIHSLIDSVPVVTDQQLELWEWVSFYYLSSQGDVCKAALPSPMMPKDLQKGYIKKSEEQFRLNPAFEDTGVAAILKRSPKQQSLLDEIIRFLTENERESVSRLIVRTRHDAKRKR